MTVILFAAAAAAIIAVWNRFFRPVPLIAAILFFVVTAGYQAQTLFTKKVDVGFPASVYPWHALGRKGPTTNTGIVTMELAPWTEAARRSIRAGEWPLWNRDAASGTPLIANQQTALLHPFTLLGLLLPIGKTFTLSASLRIFTLLMFTFLLLRWWDVCMPAAICGAITFAFCTFNVVWLLFPLGLSTMMLPVALVGIEELRVRQSMAAFVLLVTGLALIVLGGHPEQAIWSGLFAGAYALYRRVVLLSLLAAILAIALTAVWWLPTVALLTSTTRHRQIDAIAVNHRFGVEWLLPLIAPNVLGTIPAATYHPPQPRSAALLDDYSEVASGYAGLAMIALTLAALASPCRRPIPFFLGAMAFALLTIFEVPGWRDVMHHIPLVRITLWQRLRFVLPLSESVIGAIVLDEFLRDRISRRRIAVCLAIAGAASLAIFASATTLAVALGSLLALRLPKTRAVAAIALLAFAELVSVTWRYNPPFDAVLPRTGALAFLQHDTTPHRFVAAGWSLLPDTPSFYGLEDVKSTDPFAGWEYVRLAGGYLGIRGYDQIVSDFSQPFFDFLNIRYIYVPPDQDVNEPRFRVAYRGDDGSVLENRAALPRYFFISGNLIVEPKYGEQLAWTKQIADYRKTAVVEANPDHVAPTGIGTIRVRSYRANATELEVESSGWNLLVTSDSFRDGWRAAYNGRPARVLRVNGAFIGMFVPPGHGIISLEYRPYAFVIGAWVSGLTLVIGIAAACAIRGLAGAGC